MKLLKAKKKDRARAVKNAEVQTRNLMKKDPYISKDDIVAKTGFSEYTINKIYMGLRREHIKKAVQEKNHAFHT